MNTQAWISGFKNRRILVAGEIGIDEYILGECRRISPEAPVPVVEVTSESSRLGLSGNVAQNCASLGATVEILSVVGADADADKVGRLLDDTHITSQLLEDPSRPTLRKVRVIAEKQHLVRVDYEKTHRLSPELTDKFRRSVLERLPDCDALIVQDYGKGLWFTDTLSVMEEARILKKPVYVDPNRRTPLDWYRGATLLTPNMAEAEELCGFHHTPSDVLGPDDRVLKDLAQRILERTQADHSLITCGAWGMVGIERSTQTYRRIPTFAREVFDVTGAGDTVIAVMALMHLSGAAIEDCMRVANAAAGVVVGRLGASCVKPEELEDALLRLTETGPTNTYR